MVRDRLSDHVKVCTMKTYLQLHRVEEPFRPCKSLYHKTKNSALSCNNCGKGLSHMIKQHDSGLRKLLANTKQGGNKNVFTKVQLLGS